MKNRPARAPKMSSKGLKAKPQSKMGKSAPKLESRSSRSSKPDARPAKPFNRGEKPALRGEKPALRSEKPAFRSEKPVPARQERPQARRSAEPAQPMPKLKGMLLWGTHAVREAWMNPERKCLVLYASQSGEKEMEAAFEAARQEGLRRPSVIRMERADMDRLLPRGTVHQGLLLEVEPLPELSLDDLLGLDHAPEVVVVLDQVTDPHNVGAIMRSAIALGAGAVIVTERNAPGTTGILAKTSCGAAEHIPLVAVTNLARSLEALKAENYWCVGLAEEGKGDLSESKLSSGRIALVMGAEGDGLRRLTREHCDELARLPTSGPIGSLNVSNAAAVALYEVRRQRGN